MSHADSKYSDFKVGKGRHNRVYFSIPINTH